MAGPNTTGKPQTSDYNLGRGVLYFAPIDTATGQPKGYRDLGNCPEFSINIEVETLEHQSSRQGLRVTDKEVIISQTLNLSFSLDEINHENLALVTSGAKGTSTNVTEAGFGQYTMVAAADVEKGRWYDIKNSSNGRAYDVQSAELTVEDTSAVSFVLNTDYELDTTQGRILLLSSSSKVQDAIDNTRGINVTLAARAGAVNLMNEVRALTSTNITGALKFIAVNPANNDVETEFQFNQVQLKPDGDFSLIGDEFTTMSFTAVAESNSLANTNSPTLTIRNIATADA